MRLVIAEKPSVAMNLAKVLGAGARRDGYTEGNGWLVSWCVGHLVELANADAYDPRYSKWAYEDLPIFPRQWHYIVLPNTKKQFDTLADLMKRPDVESLVCATDAGREGELIFRLVYQRAGCAKPVQRLWISSMEESAIRRGFDTLSDSASYDNLYAAALCRSQADWLVGINATRLFTTLYRGRTLNVGRVLTPTLALLVEREEAITGFKKEKFYTVELDCGDFRAVSERFSKKPDADKLRMACDGGTAVVRSVERKDKAERPPKLYDLTTLQREANRYYGFTAQQTLDLVQSLYEKKLLTYPRTDSQYITEDMEGTARRVITAVCSVLPLFAGVSFEPDIRRVANNAKVTDHHAIIPTVQLERQDIADLPKTEQQILNLVAMRLLCATGGKHTYDETEITISCGGYSFAAKGRTVTAEGWKAVERRFKDSLKSKEKEEADKELPLLHENDVLESVAATVTEHYTSPPKAYTEDTLLSAMETAGNGEFDEDTEKKGLGTPATRAGIIEKLVKSGYAERKGKSLTVSKDGINLIAVLPDAVTSPAMTAEWENTLMQIERGEANASDFLNGIIGMTADLVKAHPSVSSEEASRFQTERESIGTCPRCGSPVYVGKGRYYCGNRDCSFCMWEDSKFFTAKKKKLTKKIAADLLKDGRAKLKGCYSEKTGKTYDAAVVLDDPGDKPPRFKLEFDRR